MRKEICEPHKATIKNHLEQSLAVGVSLSEIHQELVRIFEHKGRYSIQQISAITSWLRSNILGSKRVNGTDWDENDGEKNEDMDFSNTEKNTSREWHTKNFLGHITEEKRQQMSMLLMPGQNTYDFEEMQRISFPANRFLAFIRGDVPRANAKFLRNCRKFSVPRARIGNMEDLLVQEKEPIDAGYLDFFGQFCASYQKIFELLPLRPDGLHYFGVNMWKGREHSPTKDHYRLLDTMLDNQGILTSENADELGRILEEKIIISPTEIEKARQRVQGMLVFANMGGAHKENWLLKDELREFAMCTGEHEDFDDLNPFDQKKLIRSMFKDAEGIAELLARCLVKSEVDPALANNLAAFKSLESIVFNHPVVKKIESFEYVSPKNNSPFISYFGILETRRTELRKCEEALTFYLKIISHLFPAYRKGESNGGTLSVSPIRNVLFSPLAHRPGYRTLLTYNDAEGKKIAEIKMSDLTDQLKMFAEHHNAIRHAHPELRTYDQKPQKDERDRKLAQKKELRDKIREKRKKHRK